MDGAGLESVSQVWRPGGLLLLAVFSGLCVPKSSPSFLGQFWANNIAVLLGDTGKLLGSINVSISLLSFFSIWKGRGELSVTCSSRSPGYRKAE